MSFLIRYIPFNYFKGLYLSCFLLFCELCFAQFPGAVGTIGSTAINKDSSIIIDWAASSIITRGYQNINNTSAGYTTVGDNASATGQAGINGVASLGDRGSIILTFTTPISNGIGFDFAVFENSFNDNFLELAFVEVSSDGIHFFRFPSESNTDTTTQISSFDLLDPTKINNLAGKYRVNYGTPFNLDEIPDTSLLDKNAIRYIKIIDVIGSMQSNICSRDSKGHKINDPFPTEFPSGGFDIDAVAVINNQSITGLHDSSKNDLLSISPNPTSNFVKITSVSKSVYQITVSNALGNILLETTNESLVDLSNYENGIYIFTLSANNNSFYKKVIKN